MSRADVAAMLLVLLVGPALAYGFLGVSWPLWGWLALFVLHLILAPPTPRRFP